MRHLEGTMLLFVDPTGGTWTAAVVKVKDMCALTAWKNNMFCILVTALAICHLIHPQRLCLQRTLGSMQPWHICCRSPSSHVGVSTSYWGNWPSTPQCLQSNPKLEHAAACRGFPSTPLSTLACVALHSITAHAQNPNLDTAALSHT